MAGKSSTHQGAKTPQHEKKSGVAHPGMMGDGTEEQNLSERGDPAARIKKAEAAAAFKQGKKK